MATFDHIPILDLEQAKDPQTKAQFQESLLDAIINVGFFYLKNTIPHDIEDSMVKKSIELFNLPMDKKMELEMANSKHFLGYAKVLTETTAGVPDNREQFDFATELPPPGPEEPIYNNIRQGPNQWPKESLVPGFREAISSYMTAISDLSRAFTHLLAETLMLPPHTFDKYFFDPPLLRLKLAKYPSPKGQNQDHEQGVGAHKDTSFLTFLLQPTRHTSLSVQNKSGEWISAPPIPRTLVVNIGRILEVLTGGVCIATPHRVSMSPSSFISPETGGDLGHRYSFPVFLGFDMKTIKDDKELDIPLSIRKLVEGQEERRSDAEKNWQKFCGDNFAEGLFLAGVASHKNVAERWYPELLNKASEFHNGLKKF